MYVPMYGIVISLSSCPETVPFSRIYLEISFVVSKSREEAFWKRKNELSFYLISKTNNKIAINSKVESRFKKDINLQIDLREHSHSITSDLWVGRYTHYVLRATL